MISPHQISNYLLEISQQIQAISPEHIQNDLFIMHPAPKRVMKLNKRRISIVSPRRSGSSTILIPNHPSNPQSILHSNSHSNSYSKLSSKSISPLLDVQAVHGLNAVNEESKSPDSHHEVMSNELPLSSTALDPSDESQDDEDGAGPSSNSEDEAVQNILKQPMFRVKTLREVQIEDLSLKKECESRFYAFSEPATKYIPIPLDDQYPDELYIETTESETVQNSNYFSFPNPTMALYPDDEGANLQDFIGRKFHLNANIVKQWVSDRANLLRKMPLNENVDFGDSEGLKYRKFAVIDVRCHDFVGGNIPFCYNVNFEGFESMLNDLLIQFQYESDMVFHCMYSQHRGPRGAFWYWEHRRKWERRYPRKLRKQRIWVLDGGFKQWIGDHILDGDLVANVDSKYWDEEYFPLTGREFFYRNDWRVPDSDDDDE